MVTNEPIKWHVGDWCFYDFKLVVIEEMNGDSVKGVCDGFFNFGGVKNDMIYPLTMKNKVISDAVSCFYTELTEINRNLNFPLLHNYFVQKWHEVMRDVKKSNDVYDELRKFIKDVKELIINAEINGMKIIRD